MTFNQTLEILCLFFYFELFYTTESNVNININKCVLSSYLSSYVFFFNFNANEDIHNLYVDCKIDLKAQLQSVKHKIEIKINWLRLFSAQTDLNRTLSVASLVWTTDAEHSLETVTMRPSVEPEYV